jgi:fumarylacetoacetate (FAA) hydrolase
MRVGSLKIGGPDGTLVIVDKSLNRAMYVPSVAACLREAIENWDTSCELLKAAYQTAERDRWQNSFALKHVEMASPLPRAFQFIDGSAYLSHMEKARKARGANMPAQARSVPLMYQGVSDTFWPPIYEVPFSEEVGIDLEAELAVIVDEVPMGTTVDHAPSYIRFIMLLNDWSLRELTSFEVPRGFGFLQSKPPCSGGPVAVSPEILGESWQDGRIKGRVRCFVNEKKIGSLDAGLDMTFNFPEMIAHASKTRRLTAGTIIGGGTISNLDPGSGYGCLAELRADEQLKYRVPRTPFLSFGDTIRIEMLGADGLSVFGAIEQKVVCSKSR